MIICDNKRIIRIICVYIYMNGMTFYSIYIHILYIYIKYIKYIIYILIYYIYIYIIYTLYIYIYIYYMKVFDRNTRMIPFIMFSLTRINGTLPYVYIYICICLTIGDYSSKTQAGPTFEQKQASVMDAQPRIIPWTTLATENAFGSEAHLPTWQSV